MLQIARSLVLSQLVSLEFFIDIKSFRSHYGPGVDSTPNRNEYQEHFLVDKCGRCVRLTTLSPSCAVVMKSGSLNFLEPSGPVQACNGTAFYAIQSLKIHMLIHLLLLTLQPLVVLGLFNNSVPLLSILDLRRPTNNFHPL